jgi:hypothetical protein
MRTLFCALLTFAAGSAILRYAVDAGKLDPRAVPGGLAVACVAVSNGRFALEFGWPYLTGGARWYGPYCKFQK